MAAAIGEVVAAIGGYAGMKKEEAVVSNLG